MPRMILVVLTVLALAPVAHAGHGGCGNINPSLVPQIEVSGSPTARAPHVGGLDSGLSHWFQTDARAWEHGVLTLASPLADLHVWSWNGGTTCAKICQPGGVRLPVQSCVIDGRAIIEVRHSLAVGMGTRYALSLAVAG